MPGDPEIQEYSGIATFIFMIGWATGGLIFGMFGDRFGRARTMIFTILIYSAFTGLSALSQGWFDFAVYRFFTGMGVGGEFAAGVTLVAEVMPNRARPYALGLLQALSAVGNMMAAMISFVIPPQMEFNGVAGWRWMFVVGVVPALVVFVLFRGLKEPEGWQKARREAKERAANPDDFHKQLGDIKELFTDPRWRYNTIVGVILAAAGVMGLWGVGFWTPELVRGSVLQGEPREVQDYYASMASLLQNFAAFFGIYGFGLMAGRFGRRTAFLVALILAVCRHHHGVWFHDRAQPNLVDDPDSRVLQLDDLRRLCHLLPRTLSNPLTIDRNGLLLQRRSLPGGHGAFSSWLLDARDPRRLELTWQYG